MATLTYQGHGSFYIRSNAGAVLYFDPYAGEGYELPADLVLVTHGHHDHDRVELVVNKKPDCVVLTWKEALSGGVYRRFEEKGFAIEAVPAQNKNHDPAVCVGYVLTVDGVRLYASGDTSTTEFMAKLPAYALDYALFPIDGVYNMDAAEAARCAVLCGARHNIPIHTKPGALFSREAAERFEAQGRILLEPGQELTLSTME